MANEQPGCLEPNGHLRQLMRHRLERADRLTELAALLGECHRGLERGTGEPHDVRPDTGPEHVEDAQADAEPVIDRADDVAVGNEHPVEMQSTDPIRPHRVDRHARQAFGVGRYQERRDTAGAGIGQRPSEDRVDIGLWGPHDPHLRTRQPPAPRLLDRWHRHRCKIGTHVRFGQRHGGHRLTTAHRRCPLVQRSVLPETQRHIDPTDLDGQRRRRFRCDASQSLPARNQAGRRNGPVAGAAELRGEERRQQPQVGQTASA